MTDQSGDSRPKLPIAKVQILDSGIRLYKEVDGQFVHLDEDEERRHLNWLWQQPPAVRIAAGDVGPHVLPKAWTAEAN